MKLIKATKNLALCLVILIFEMTFGKYVEIKGAVPMLTFCFCITFSLFEDDVNYISLVSAVAGALLDVLSNHGFGTYTFLFPFFAIIAFFIKNNLFSSQILLLIFESFFLSLFLQILYYIIHIIDIKGDFMTLLLSIMIPTAVYNIVVCLVLYPIIKSIFFKRR